MSDPSNTPPRGGTLPGLDGLRAIAVFLVLLHHQFIVKLGWVGVQLFFVLSGYLISRLLHRAKDAPLGSYLRDFYGRRTLRIFPLYYSYLAVLAVALVAGLVPRAIGERLPYAALYLTNIYPGNEQAEGARLLMHFWSLAVEEQFYLVWPFLIYFCPRHALRRVLILLVILGPLIRYSVLWSFALPGYLTITHMDAFAIGALSSLFPWNLPLSRGLAFGVPLGIVGLFALNIDVPLPGTAYGWGYIFGLSAFNAASALLIEALVRNQLFPALFEHKVMRYLGKISYGIYIFHFPVQAMIEKAMLESPLLVRLGLQIAVTLVISAASFALLESPFLALKDRWFPAQKIRAPEKAVSPVV
jgi:peptidoglycan/LPS O-acetylase OafA/YrhL